MYAQNPDLVGGVLGAVRGANAYNSHPPAPWRPSGLEHPRRGVSQLMHSPRHRYRKYLHIVWMPASTQVWPRQIQPMAHSRRVAEGDEAVRHLSASGAQVLCRGDGLQGGASSGRHPMVCRGGFLHGWFSAGGMVFCGIVFCGIRACGLRLCGKAPRYTATPVTTSTPKPAVS